MKTEMLSKN